MNLRYGTIADAELISQLGAKTFYETFANYNTPDDIDSYLRKSFSPEIQFQELSSPDVIFIVAESEGTPIGYAQLVFGSRDESIQASRPMEIRRIYAVQDYVGKGIGSELMKKIIAESRERGCECIWLGVWEKNTPAIAFYKKWGFRTVGNHIFMLGSDPQNDHIMELALT